MDLEGAFLDLEGAICIVRQKVEGHGPLASRLWLTTKSASNENKSKQEKRYNITAEVNEKIYRPVSSNH